MSNEDLLDSESNNPKEPEAPTSLSEPTLAQLIKQQNLPMAILAGLGAALVGGICWAMWGLMTGTQHTYIAMGVGLIVGLAVKKVGKGYEEFFGIIGGTCAFLGCFLGNILCIVAIASNELNLGFFETIWVIEFSVISNVMNETFSFVDLLFYGVAMFIGYKISINRLAEKENEAS